MNEHFSFLTYILFNCLFKQFYLAFKLCFFHITYQIFRILEKGKLEVSDKIEGLPSIVWVTPVEPEE